MTATLADITATTARATIPEFGRWYVECDLDGEHELSGRATCAIADLTLQGAILAGGPGNGRSNYTLVAGAGGWGLSIPAKAYQDDAGIKIADVIRDAAAEVGETFVSTDTTRVGPGFTRAAGPACRVLEQLAPGAWYVDEAGTTRLGKRAAGVLPADVTHGPVDLARGTVTLASESIVTILPGLVVDGLDVVDVLHECTPDGLRSTVWGNGGAGSRRLGALRMTLDQLDPDRKFRAPTEYRVTSTSGDRINGQPVRVGLGMPDLARVQARPGLPGCKGGAKLGSRVLIGFVEADPSRPYVCAYEDSEGSGFVPPTLVLDASSTIKLGASASRGVARDADTVCLGYCLWDVALFTLYLSPVALGPLLTVYTPWAVFPPGTTLSAFLPVPTPSVPPTPGVPGTPWNGSIITYSPKVKAA